MTTSELKIELIQKICSCNDINLLLKIKEILTISDNYQVNEPSTVYHKEEKVYVFNEWQQERIDKAMLQYENGECISDEEAEKEIQAWFKEEEKLFGQ